jgi:serine-aspartate repeat-containing protein C/D/E
LIPLAPGQTSQENNFSEVQVEQTIPQLPPPPPAPPVWTTVSMVLPPTIGWSASPQMRPDAPAPIPNFGTAGALNMTWHLSVVNGGSPRSPEGGYAADTWRTVAFLNSSQWASYEMNDGQWQWPEGMAARVGSPDQSIVFGIHDAIPISGDFNGDGVAELGMFYQGNWFIDINGNGRWDEQDLWASLGGEDDLPVVGDWDGDGKDDIGIFGPEWYGDERAIKAEPGLPDPENENRPVPKNLPPEASEATDGHRVLKRTASGKPRLDVIDHVFRFGMSQDVPVAGDWNGDGISTVGVFRDGTWYLDTDGDGRFTERDELVQLGQAGDRPVVGDFNADGIDDLGVFRLGIWHLDSDGNRSLDAHDEVFRRGEAGDKPVVGDFDGDGQDDTAPTGTLASPAMGTAKQILSTQKNSRRFRLATTVCPPSHAAGSA